MIDISAAFGRMLAMIQAGTLPDEDIPETGGEGKGMFALNPDLRVSPKHANFRTPVDCAAHREDDVACTLGYEGDRSGAQGTLERVANDLVEGRSDCSSHRCEYARDNQNSLCLRILHISDS